MPFGILDRLEPVKNRIAFPLVSAHDGSSCSPTTVPSVKSKEIDMKPTVVATPDTLQPIVQDASIKKIGNFDGIRAGWFGYKPNSNFNDYDNYSVRWEHCRDRVQIILRSHINDNGLWFSHRKNTGPNVRLFIKKLEKMLKVKPRSTFADTDHPLYSLWMDVSPWWMENLVRRSFLTLALRSGQSYKPKKDNFVESFEKNKYGKDSMTAVKLFLAGYTNYRGKNLHMFEGWARLFRHKNEDEIKKLLFPRKSKNNTVQNMANW